MEHRKITSPGTHRPAIQGINSRSRAHSPRKPRDFTSATKHGLRGRFACIYPTPDMSSTTPGLGFVVERNIKQHRTLTGLMNDVRPSSAVIFLNLGYDHRRSLNHSTARQTRDCHHPVFSNRPTSFRSNSDVLNKLADSPF